VDPLLAETLSSESIKKDSQPVSAPYLFRVFEYARPQALPSRHSLADLDQVVIGRGAQNEFERLRSNGRQLRITVPDRWMSSLHARLYFRGAQWVLEDAGSRNGSFVGGARVAQRTLADGDLIELGHAMFLFRALLRPRAEAAPDLDGADLDPRMGLSTLSPALADDLEQLRRIAPSPVSVLITGESGTGKEVIARAVHLLSGRGGPFVAINCGALAPNLVESELFGYRRGAFSGALEDRLGLVRSAQGGTLLLDEIGELPLGAQVALLRVLQEREVMPVGATRPVSVEFRLCAATHRPVRELVDEGRVRADFMARISGYDVHLPPLRARREDLGLLIGVLLRRGANERVASVSFTKEAARALFAYSWPLNVRELEKCLGTAVVLDGDGPISVEHLSPEVRQARIASADQGSSPPLTEEEQRFRDRLIALLTQHRGNLSAIARELGRDRVQVRRWLRRFRIEGQTFRSAGRTT
jgi:DNA-binding NtrC family response regulator